MNSFYAVLISLMLNFQFLMAMFLLCTKWMATGSLRQLPLSYEWESRGLVFSIKNSRSHFLIVSGIGTCIASLWSLFYLFIHKKIIETKCMNVYFFSFVFVLTFLLFDSKYMFHSIFCNIRGMHFFSLWELILRQNWFSIC